MKNNQLFKSVLIIVLIVLQKNSIAQIGINADGSAPSSNSMLDVKSTNKGVMLPRIADPASIPSPTDGLLFYNTTAKKFNYYDGMAWQQAFFGNQWNVNGSSISYSSGNVGVGTSTPSASAILEASSTTKGFLPPRLTIDQRNAIANPAVGLVIYCSDCDELEIFNGFLWKTIIGTAACVSSTLPFLKICDQIWMPKNLEVTNYRNGDIIPQVTDPSVWASLTIGAWCWYNNDSATYGSTYGKLYNWYAVNDPRGLAPIGWHIPSDVELSTLSMCLGGDNNAGSKMKKVGIAHWSSPNLGATNSSGFGGLPGGVRWFSGAFALINTDGYFWSSTAYSSLNSYWRNLNYNQENFTKWNYDKPFGFSVRCVRD